MKQNKYLFIDRDGTLIVEPADQQVDSIDKLAFLPGVFTELACLQQAGYRLVMMTNQDGFGTASFPQADFLVPQQLMLNIFSSQGIEFEAIKICPHLPEAQCECRKPKLGLVMDYLLAQNIDKKNSYVIGDRDSDMQLAEKMQIGGLQIGSSAIPSWKMVKRFILQKPRIAKIQRYTNETKIDIEVDLDQSTSCHIQTGIGFFDHMLEQLIKHAGIGATIQVVGDLVIDDHHSIEDTAIALGQALREALADKRGIARFGSIVPMDEAQATVALDLSGRSYCQFNYVFNRDKVGDLSTEMVPHFFRSFAQGLQATLHIQVAGDNTHHIVESLFKCVGRALRQAIAVESSVIPSTKGVL